MPWRKRPVSICNKNYKITYNENDSVIFNGDNIVYCNIKDATTIYHSFNTIPPVKDEKRYERLAKVRKRIVDAHSYKFQNRCMNMVNDRMTYNDGYLTYIRCTKCGGYHKARPYEFECDETPIVNKNKYSSIKKSCMSNLKSKHTRDTYLFYKRKYRRKSEYNEDVSKNQIRDRNCLEYYDFYECDFLKAIKETKNLSYIESLNVNKLGGRYVYYKGKGEEGLRRREEMWQPNGRVPQDYDELFESVNWREMLANRMSEVHIDSPSDDERRRPDFYGTRIYSINTEDLDTSFFNWVNIRIDNTANTDTDINDRWTTNTVFNGTYTF